MRILGISSNYHDASAALVVDGRLVATSAEERFTLHKHDPNFPKLAIDWCLKGDHGFSGPVDLVAYHEEPSAKLSRTLSSAFVRYPFSFPTFATSMREGISSTLWFRNMASECANIDPARVVFQPHHFSHAAYSFLTSPFEKAAVLTVDAVGEWTSSALFLGDRSCGADALEVLEVVPFPHSLGLAYSAFTAFLGFKVNDGECSVMALSSWGRPRYLEQVRKILVRKGHTLELDLRYFNFSRDDDLPLSGEFFDLFGKPRHYKTPLPFDSLTPLGQGGAIDAESQRFADVAASIQAVVEEEVQTLARRVKELTGVDQLCLSGGVAMNATSNGKLVRSGIFREVHIPNDPGDGGGAAGAALYAHLVTTGKAPTIPHSPCLGSAHRERDVLDIISDDENFRSLKVSTFDSKDLLTDRVANLLAQGKVVGWFQGRFENGPRALGHRSILCDPGNLETVKKLSKSVKKRAPFRPYAVSLTEAAAKKAFPAMGDLGPYRWMQSTIRVADGEAQGLRGALHCDLSTRPQVLSQSDDPLFHQLLEAFGGKTGKLPALLNTSFNPSGFPLVRTDLDAFLMFVRTRMDVLVLNQTVIEKP